MQGLAIVPALVLGLGIAKMPNSPCWLMIRNQGGKARKVLTKIRGRQNVNDELQEIHYSIATEESSNWSDLKSPVLRLPLIIGIGLAIFQQATGINTVIYYAPTILQFAGLKSAGASILASTGVETINFLFTIVEFVVRRSR